MPTASAIDRRAAALEAAHDARARFVPFVGADVLSGLDDAYAVQHAFVQRLLRARATRIAGYKVGLTSPRMQAMCGIDSPIGGVVLADGIHASGARLSRAAYGRLGIEFEIGVSLAHDLPAGGAPYDRAAVSGAVAAVGAVIEVIDDRGADYAALDMRSLVADNAWNAGLVLGAFQADFGDLAAVAGRVMCDGVEIDRGAGADVLGHPFASLEWLANHLARQGHGLHAGDVVATGSLVTTRFPTQPGVYVFELSGLGQVRLDIVD